MSKFIQIAIDPWCDRHKSILFALDNDGTIWMRKLGGEDRPFEVFAFSPKEPKPTGTKKEKGDNPLAERPNDVSVETWVQFKAVRKAKRSPLTKRALATISEEAAKANMSLEKALLMCLDKGWQGFKAEWVVANNGQTNYFKCPNRVRKEGKSFMQPCGRPAADMLNGKHYCFECFNELVARQVKG